MSRSQFTDGPTARCVRVERKYELPSSAKPHVTRAGATVQRRALDAAYAELVPVRRASGHVADERLDSLHEAYIEILGRLPENPGWCCEGCVPSVRAARTQLAVRARQRRIDAWRRSRRNVRVEDFEALELVASEGDRDGGLAELHTYLRSRLPASEHAKLNRFIQHAVLDVPHAMIARESGMSHAALRVESRRFARHLAPLLDGYVA